MPSRTANKTDRIFVRNGRRHYRRGFSTTETRVGVVILFVLASVVTWVAWKGAHPDPSLFMLEADLSQAGAAEVGTGAAADRGPMPPGLAAAGWTEGRLSQFDPDNLYVKINGREGYFKALGFERLYAASITLDEDAQTAVDIELYDLGTAANALGAYSGERPDEILPVVGNSGMMHIDRNAFFMTQGRYYLRALGSQESSVVTALLEYLRDRFLSELPGEPLPWGYTLFSGELGMDPGAVSYMLENAFSFGFAGNVYAATLDDGETELFVTPAADEAAAVELALRYVNGFRNYGSAEGDYIKDRYLGSYAHVTNSGPWVVGFRRAPDPEAAAAALARLATLVRGFPLPAITGEPAVNIDAEESYEDVSDDY